VRLHVEGAAAEVERFLALVRDRFDGYIENETQQGAAATGQYQGLEVFT
jgi:hypothetical protein